MILDPAELQDNRAKAAVCLAVLLHGSLEGVGHVAVTDALPVQGLVVLCLSDQRETLPAVVELGRVCRNGPWVQRNKGIRYVETATLRRHVPGALDLLDTSILVAN